MLSSKLPEFGYSSDSVDESGTCPEGGYCDHRVDELFNVIGAVLANCDSWESQLIFLEKVQTLFSAHDDGTPEYMLTENEMVQRELERHYATSFLDWARVHCVMITEETLVTSDLPSQLIFAFNDGWNGKEIEPANEPVKSAEAPSKQKVADHLRQLFHKKSV